MKKFEVTKRVLSVLLAVIMVLSYVPVRAMAEECSHHRHDENCGYGEAVEGSPCNHQHTENCTEEVTACIHVHGVEAGCVFTPAAEAVEESWACEHVCTLNSGCKTAKCNHVCPADGCGFVAAVEASPCTFVCEECLNEDVCPNCKSTGGAHGENCPKAVCPHCGNLNEAHGETCSTRCTSAEGCIDGNHGTECPLYMSNAPKTVEEETHTYGLFSDPEGKNPVSSITGAVKADTTLYLLWDTTQSKKPDSISVKITTDSGEKETYSFGYVEENEYFQINFEFPDTRWMYFYLDILGEDDVELSLEVTVDSGNDNVNPAHTFDFYSDAEGNNPVFGITGAVGTYAEVYLMWDPEQNAAPTSIRVDTFSPVGVQEYTAFEAINQGDGCIKIKIQIPQAQSMVFSLTCPDSEQPWLVRLMISATSGEPGSGGEEKVLDSIAVTTAPSKTTYVYGEELDAAGGKLTLTYSDNSTEEVEMTVDMISGYSSTIIGEQTLMVTYQGKNATFAVTVAKQQMTLYANGMDHIKMREDRGMPDATFSTDEAGTQIVSVSALETDGVVSFKETNTENNTAWIVFTGEGTGTVTYETDTAVYTLPVTATSRYVIDITHTCDRTTSHLFLMHEDGQTSFHDVEMSHGNSMGCAVCFYDYDSKESVKISFDKVVLPGFIKSFTNGPGGIEATGVGEGDIEYKVGEITYKLPVSSVLPVYGIYSAPQRTAENHLGKIPGNVGSNKIVYLLWDDNATSAHEAEVIVNGERYSSSMCTKKTDENNKPYFEISFKVPDVNWIRFRVTSEFGTELANFEVELIKSGSGSGQQNQCTVNVEINNTPVTVGIAAAMGSEGDLMDLNNGGGANVTHDPNYPDTGLYLKLCVGAMVNFGDPEAEAVANQDIYSEILKTASITVKKWENLDGSDSSEPNLKIATPYEGTVSGVKTLVTDVTADPLKLGMCQLELAFAYGGQEYKTYFNITYENPDMSVNVSEDTNLAEVLSSSQKLIKWLEDNHLDALRAYGGDGFVNINLPAKVYDDPIVVNIDEPAFRKIRIRGSTGGSGRTVMRNLTIKQGVFTVEDIDFVAGNSDNQVAIIHDNDAENYHSTLGSVSGCTFQGYPVGVKDIGYGHIRYISDSLFYNCDTSVIIHPETTGAGDNGGTIEYHGNTFMNTDVAISLEALPVGISAYRTQFNDNTFLFCDLEFNMVPTGTFYFMRNYYGGHERGNEKYEDWKHPGNKADEQIRHHARIQEADKSGTKTVTNPVRKTIETPCDFWIYTGEDQHTAIFNAESARMLIDGATFEDPVAAASSESIADKDIPVSILDNNGNEIAQWTF